LSALVDDLPIDDAQQLIRAIVDLTSMADRVLPTRSSPLTVRLRAHLGIGGEADDLVPNTSVTFDPIEHANLQLALNHERDTAAQYDEFGLAPDIGQYGGVSLASLMAGSWQGPGETARQFVSIEISATASIRCLRAGLVLTDFGGSPVAAMLYLTDRHRPALVLEVAAPTQDAADGFLAHIRDLMAVNNVLRGKVVTFAFGEYGGFGLTFTTVPSVARHEVILPDRQLDAIEEHALGITEVRADLLAAGQHVKRGLLLYGPPGTGKTHTVSYLLGRMTDRTTIILSGASVGAVGQAGTLARKLAPATIVIEDVDLIGMDRGLPGGEHNPMLFQLLNEMDGLQADDDVLFILTTNRADLLEPALAARPGRVDQAIEIDVPDAAGRRALFELYLCAPIDDAAMEQVCERTAGVAAAFIKEVARRATLRSIRSGEDLSSAVIAATDDLFETSTPLLKASLAAAIGASQPARPGPAPAGWATHHPHPHT
jgi:hypothetical protein